MTLLLYLGKVILCSGILLGYYRLFLQNNRFHHYNRFYLQATLVLSIVLPFLKIPLWPSSQNPVNQVVYQTLDVLTVNYGEHDGMVGQPGLTKSLFSAENILYVVYGAGVLVLLGILVRSLLYIKRISKQYPAERINNLKFYATREPGTPFSFFRSIFWSIDLPFNSKEGQQIFRHELFHVQQKHSTDIIVAELITALCWFNPFFHLLKKELKAVHEFLADQYAISDNDKYTYAELLVMQTLKGKTMPATNYFFQNHIKRRIAMITQPGSTKYSYARRLMVLPVLALLFGAMVLHAQRPVTQAITTTPLEKPLTVVIDAGHGGIDPGAHSADNSITEKDLALQICQKIRQLAPAYNIKVVMTRTSDELPANAATIHDGLRARTAITQDAHADAFVSIHTNYADPNDAVNAYSGFEIYISNKDDNAYIDESKKLGSAIVQSIGKIYPINPALLQRKSKNIWVLERNSCPALLIECGFMTNEKDLAYIRNSSNQEAIAQKILEGIVAYKKQPVTNTGTNNNTPL
jgi:N-acetylmuramoyl-L-alanine amidase